MSLSSLPGIFRETNFTPPRKQGGSFSLYLNTNLPERHTRSASNQNGRSFPTFEASKKRSVSSSILKHRQTALSDQNNSAKNIAARSKNQVIFNEEIKFWESNSGKRGKGPAVINISNVFYETSRKFNNRMIDLQEADSLKNTTELSLKEMVKVQSHFEQVTKTAHQIRFSFAAFVQESMRDLQTFQGKFFQNLKICYANLSKMRRQTNDQIKGNKKELQKVGNQLAVCEAVLSDLSQKGQQIVGQTIKVTKECVQSIGRDEMRYDFEEISEIPKTSRGGTGNVSKRTKYIELFSKNGQGRKSAQWDLGLQLGDLEIN